MDRRRRDADLVRGGRRSSLRAARRAARGGAALRRPRGRLRARRGRRRARVEGEPDDVAALDALCGYAAQAGDPERLLRAAERLERSGAAEPWRPASAVAAALEVLGREREALTRLKSALAIRWAEPLALSARELAGKLGATTDYAALERRLAEGAAASDAAAGAERLRALALLLAPAAPREAAAVLGRATELDARKSASSSRAGAAAAGRQSGRGARPARRARPAAPAAAGPRRRLAAAAVAAGDAERARLIAR